jgi:hypothetical protein
VKILLRAYPRRWRERYGGELLALLEAEPLTWRVAVDVLRCGLGQRLRGSGPASRRVLWAWSLFVIGGISFQKSSEHWQAVVPAGDRGIPAAAFDVVQAAAAVGSLAVLAGVALALPAFVRDLQGAGRPALRRPFLGAATATGIAVAALVALSVDHDVVAASVFVASAVFALFAWTYAADVAARRLPRLRLHVYLALAVSASMVAAAIAAAVWFAAVTADAPSFVGAAQLAVTATFMLAGTTLAADGVVRAVRA